MIYLYFPCRYFHVLGRICFPLLFFSFFHVVLKLEIHRTAWRKQNLQHARDSGNHLVIFLLGAYCLKELWKLPWHHGACTHALVALPSCCRRRTGPHTKLSLVEDLAIEEPEVHEHRAATAGFVRIDMSKRSSWTTAYPSTCRSTRVVDAERWWTDRKDYCGTGGRRLIAGRRKCVVRRGEDGGNRETHGQRARWEVRRK